MSQLNGFNQHQEEGYKMTPEQFNCIDETARQIAGSEKVRRTGVALGAAEAKSEIAKAERDYAVEAYNRAVKEYKVFLDTPMMVPKAPQPKRDKNQ